jgi:RecA/RadA recombinase
VASAAAILHRLGRPGAIHLGTTLTGPPTRLPTRLAPLDATLDGGLPRGRVSELTGARSTGRTARACAIAAGATRAGETIAWIDLEDALDPSSPHAADLFSNARRSGRARSMKPCAPPTCCFAAGGFALVVLDGPNRPPSQRPLDAVARAAERTRTALLVVSKRPHTATAALTSR